MLNGILKITATTYIARNTKIANVINKVSITTNLRSDCDIEME
jgi:hypothetical protein